MTSRRNFLVLAMTALGALTLPTSQPLASALLSQPQEDLIARAAQLSRELYAMYTPQSKEVRSRIGQNVRIEAHLIADPLARAYKLKHEELVGHLLDPRFGTPSDLDVYALFGSPELWNFNILDESSLETLSRELVPLAVMRAFFQKYKQPMTVSHGKGSEFADRYRDQVMGSFDPGEEFDWFSRVFNEAHNHKRTDITRAMQESFLEYRRTGKGLYVPDRRLFIPNA